MLTLTAGPAEATIAPEDGGRLASLSVGGHELLVARDDDPMRWGSYPMVPFAGRIAYGRFSFDGVGHQLPIDLGPHAIHGYGLADRWTIIGGPSDRTVTIEWAFRSPWPYAGRARQRFDLDPDRLRITMTLHAEEPQPLMGGWHPWFRRHLGLGPGTEAVLRFGPGPMYELDDDAIPTGNLVAAPDGPWDNCFTDLTHDPVIRWGDEVTLRLSSSADHWVVFTEPTHALCVEPQTDAPDAVNRGRTRVEAGHELEVWFELRWR